MGSKYDLHSFRFWNLLVFTIVLTVLVTYYIKSKLISLLRCILLNDYGFNVIKNVVLSLHIFSHFCYFAFSGKLGLWFPAIPEMHGFRKWSRLRGSAVTRHPPRSPAPLLPVSLGLISTGSCAKPSFCSFLWTFAWRFSVHFLFGQLFVFDL